ncbi:hypothetical protein SERLA73DRAFT_90909 [Serpula lacrymans var. lacrymans S7.3]|uniref:Carboxypeptidase n=2 Tax=Serpula lacrymans var. lacrymans TaxID=341189 RepID=F8Q0H3_SERL3|nr:uncharacterized protein SERLADRAFT_361831 [Serpula lacrymans var. lacrymans S7.9]EGN97802.1 hypothetical protein SERLA73DRAFT_90909 [Serpula lacrymans var. lacrymans S7.3]EGO23394.1 hypothetical protein SERLADRAFT_361831 [Serpula lacrymans var. lacrymans S7.9]
MRFKAFTEFLIPAAYFCVALAGQVPRANGVPGGVLAKRLSSRDLAAAVTTNSSSPTVGKLRITSENSSICETTPGVYQAAGYGDIATNKSMWFWFFEARSNPSTAPLVLWFNGGPGSSSMLGLFQENGPCRITNDSSSVTLNPYSWNNNANVMYIDQPIGVGFSYGVTTVGTSEEAAADVWTFLQIWLQDSRFTTYQGRDLVVSTESYGGHYGPTFASYFLSQNEAIANGSVSGLDLNLKVLTIGDGLTDPITQYPQYIVFAGNNSYHPLVNSSVIEQANTSYTQSGGCEDQIIACNNNGSNAICSGAQNFCNNYILEPLAGNYDVYYILAENPDPYPPDLTSYLAGIQSTIGAAVTWAETNDTVYANFSSTGDWMRTSKPDLESVIDSGIRVLIYDGDADYILNHDGVEAMINSLNTTSSALYAQQQFSPFVVNGTEAGLIKNADNFTFVLIYGAGHEVPAYKYGNLSYGQAASQMFELAISGVVNGTDPGNGTITKSSSAVRFGSSILLSSLSFFLAVFSAFTLL